MNLDDFIVPTSFASPVGLTPPVTESSARAANITSALPIKAKEAAQYSSASTLTPGSVPHPLTPSNRTNEFAYVERRVRRTSVDERRVSEHEDSRSTPYSAPSLTLLIRLESALLSSRLRCLPQLYR